MTRIATALLICSTLLACERKSVDLGYGFKLVGLDGRNAAIANATDRMVVDPNVMRYKVFGSIIVGERDDAGIDERLSKRYGFFVFDMRTGMLFEGLNKSQLSERLKLYGISAFPF